MASQECYFEYRWATPEFRRVGMGPRLPGTVLRRLGDAGVDAVWR
jgi:hypothetical protein